MATYLCAPPAVGQRSIFDREVYDQRHEELSQAEDSLRRLEAALAMNGIGSEDQVVESLNYPPIYRARFKELVSIYRGGFESPSR